MDALRYPMTHNRWATSESCLTAAPSQRQPLRASASEYGNFYQPVQAMAPGEATSPYGRQQPQEYGSPRTRPMLPKSHSAYQLRPAHGDHVRIPSQWQLSPPKPPPRRTEKRMLTDAGLNTQMSEIDEVVFGRDLDDSGGSVKDVRQAPVYSGAAGSTSRHLGAHMPLQRFEELPGARPSNSSNPNQQSSVDEIVFGRDMDFSGGAAKSSSPQLQLAPTASWEAPPPKPAADPYFLLGKRMLTNAGLSTQQSSVDELVFGRDMDYSGEAVKDVRSSSLFAGAYGRVSDRGAAEDPRGKRMLTDAGLNTQLSSVDELVFGRDMDYSGGAVKDVRACNLFNGAYGRVSDRGAADLMGHRGGAGAPYQSMMSAALMWPEQYAQQRRAHLAVANGHG